MELREKVVAVTAAGSAMSTEAAHLLAGRGCKFALADIDYDRVRRLAVEIERLGGEAIAVRCDVASTEEVEDFAKIAFERFGGVDLMWSHAGVGAVGCLEQIPLEHWQKVLDVNLLGTVRCMRVFLPRMIEAKSGYFAATASSLALFPDIPLNGPYIAAKAGLVGLMRCLVAYLRPLGLKASVLCPDITLTNFVNSGAELMLTGISAEECAAGLPLDKAMPAAQVAQKFIEGVENEEFLISLTPNAQTLLREQVDHMFEPGYGVVHEVLDQLK